MEKFELELISDFLIDAIEELYQFQNILENIEEEALSLEQSQNIFRIIHTLKGNSQATGFKEMARVFHLFEDVLIQFKKDVFSTDKKLIVLFYKVLSKVQNAVDLYQINIAEEIDFSEIITLIDNYNNQIDTVKRYQIAIIDDDKDTREILTEILKIEFDADFFEYSDAHFISQEIHEKKFDLILTDFKMPIIDGNTFIQNLRLTENMNSKTPVMFITGENPEISPVLDIIKDIYFIQKPFAFRRIIYYAKLSLFKT